MSPLFTVIEDIFRPKVEACAWEGGHEWGVVCSAFPFSVTPLLSTLSLPRPQLEIPQPLLVVPSATATPVR